MKIACGRSEFIRRRQWQIECYHPVHLLLRLLIVEDHADLRAILHTFFDGGDFCRG